MLKTFWSWEALCGGDVIHAPIQRVDIPVTKSVTFSFAGSCIYRMLSLRDRLEQWTFHCLHRTEYSNRVHLKTNYKGISNILCVLYFDRIYTKDHFVEKRIKTFKFNLTSQDWISKDISILKTLKISMFNYDVIRGLMNVNEAGKAICFLMTYLKL